MRYDAPGVYLEEVPSGVRPIAQVSTSNLAVVDAFQRGPEDAPVRINSFSEFERVFGGHYDKSEASYALYQFFLNGGSTAWVVRITKGTTAKASKKAINASSGKAMDVLAASSGDWGDNLRVGIGSADTGAKTFDLVVHELDPKGNRVATEIYRSLSAEKGKPNYVEDVVNKASNLVVVQHTDGKVPKDSKASTLVEDLVNDDLDKLTGGKDGSAPDATDWKGGIDAIEQIAPFLFNIMALPGVAKLTSDSTISEIYAHALKFCKTHRAFLLVDSKDESKYTDVAGWDKLDGLRDANAGLYYPWVEVPDPLNDSKPRKIPPSGTVAGVMARTDAQRGVWKAPAGTAAKLRGASPSVVVTERQNGALNTLGLNALRSFPIHGPLTWGSRTLVGADAQASEWKYIPIRRLALFLQESLSQGLKWVVFEPNDEPLWSQVRLNVGAFMQTLHRQGAFQGAAPRDAYFVKCDGDTTTEADRNLGILNIIVGFAPLKPAEFVVIKIQQMAGQAQA